MKKNSPNLNSKQHKKLEKKKQKRSTKIKKYRDACILQIEHQNYRKHLSINSSFGVPNAS